MASNWRSLPAAMLLLGLATTTALAQGVGINATGAAADTSALLDLSSTTKGLLPPRMTLVQRGAIVLPATGLVVYQTDGVSGLYWNAGTPAAALWKQVADAGAPSGGPWTVGGSNIYYNAGNVGIGTSVPNAPLGFAATMGKKITLFPAGTGDYGFGISAGRLQIATEAAGTDVAIGYDAAGTFTERFAFKNTGALAVNGNAGSAGQVLQSNGGAAPATWVAPSGGPWALNGSNVHYNAGNVGIGTNAPNAPLGFPPSLGKKITLYPGATGDVGIGVAGNRLQLYADNPNADVALGYDQAGVFNERFAVKPTGALAVNGNTGSAGQVLQSNGGGAAATWVSPPGVTYNNVYQAISSTQVFLTEDTVGRFVIPGLSQTFSVAGNARVLVSAAVPFTFANCLACGHGYFHFYIMTDGVETNDYLVSGVESRPGVFSTNFMVDVGAGSHTIEIAATHPTFNNVWIGGDVGNGLGGPYYRYGSLILQVIPQ